MSEPVTAPHARGTCEACHRVYRLPHAGRRYTCKACGGSVRETEGEPPPEPDPKEAARHRHATQRTLKRAHAVIDVVRWSYRLGAVAYAVAALFAVLALARPEVPVREGILVVGLTTGLSILMGMAAMHVFFTPFLWTIGIAVLATAVTVVHALGPNPYGMAAWGSGAWALFAWAALVPTHHFRRLIREHKDMYVLQHASARTRRSLKGHTAVERHERLMRAMRRAARRTWKLSTAIAVVVALASTGGTAWVLDDLRLPLLEDSIATFEASWNAGDRPGVVACLDPRVRGQEGARLTAWTRAHGWTAALPALGAGRDRADDGDSIVDYELAGSDGATVPLSVRWILTDEGWHVASVDLGEPPVEPFLEGFVAAWNASDPEGVVAFFAEENRASRLETARTSAERHGWSSYPPVQETRITSRGEGNAAVEFDLEQGSVETRWHLRPDGTWGLSGLRFPSIRIREDTANR